MTNLQVARCLVGNAKAYAKSGDLATVQVNLDEIEKLLESPEQKNQEYDWGDFK